MTRIAILVLFATSLASCADWNAEIDWHIS
jgi:predicted small secreted protein